MKSKRYILSISIIIIIMIASLYGCSVAINEEIGDKVSDEINDEFEIHRDPAPVTIRLTNSKMKNELIQHIDVSKSSSRENAKFTTYEANILESIKEFYSPPRIDGFEMFIVSVNEYGFVYYYAPSEALKSKEEYRFSNIDGIEIVIDRPESRDMNASDLLIDMAHSNNMKITDDNFVYGEDNHILGKIGDSVFRISVPVKQANYEWQRDLALQLIKSSELVNVQAELDAIKQRGE